MIKEYFKALAKILGILGILLLIMLATGLVMVTI